MGIVADALNSELIKAENRLVGSYSRLQHAQSQVVIEEDLIEKYTDQIAELKAAIIHAGGTPAVKSAEETIEEAYG